MNLSSTIRAYNVASFAFDLAKASAGGPGGMAMAVAEEIVFSKLSYFRPITKMNDKLIGIFAKIWGKGLNLRIGKGYDAVHLEHNLKQMLGPLPPNHVAHHLVPETSKSMSILKKYNIDPNSVSNGVMLPNNKNMGSISAHHTGRHCKKYYKYVDTLIMGAASSKEGVINALSLIRQELLSGSISVQNCY